MHRPKKEVALAALSGLLLALSFPRWNFSYFAFIAFIPLFFACENKLRKQAFSLGWITGLIFFGCSLSWVTMSMHNYGGLPWVPSYFFLLLFASYLAIYIGLFALSSCFIKKNLLFVAPISFTALEYLRGHLLTGFPWNALGYSQANHLPLIQIADISSVYGVSFLIVLINAALFLIIQTAYQEKKIACVPVATLVLSLLVVLSYGFYRLSQPMEDQEKSLTVGVVQGNIDQAIKWNDSAREGTIQTYERLSLSFQTPPDLVVWPEAALPVFFQNELVYQRRLIDLADKGKFNLLFGSPAFKIDAATEKIVLLNSAYLLAEGRVSQYDKMHLVPFGEYVPLQSLLFFVNKMVEGVGNFVSGEVATVMNVGGAKIGTVICYEVIFPELVRRFAKNGANVLVTITNDAWFGQSAAPYQHFSMVVFRAIENRMPFARAANTGISGFIDAHGKVLQQSNLFVEEAQVERLGSGIRKTFYTEHGDIFAIGTLLLWLYLIVSSYWVFRASTAKRV